MANATHKITIAGNTASIVLGDVYDNGGDSNIGSVLGISKLGDDEQLPDGTFPIEIGAGLNKGLLARLAIRYQTGTSAIKTARIVCPIDKAYTAVTALIGKNYRGGTVRSVSVPQRRRLT